MGALGSRRGPNRYLTRRPPRATCPRRSRRRSCCRCTCRLGRRLGFVVCCLSSPLRRRLFPRSSAPRLPFVVEFISPRLRRPHRRDPRSSSSSTSYRVFSSSSQSLSSHHLKVIVIVTITIISPQSPRHRHLRRRRRLRHVAPGTPTAYPRTEERGNGDPCRGPVLGHALTRISILVCAWNP